MPTSHSLENLKSYHLEAIQFFEAELMLLKEAIPKITDNRISKTATLLMSGGQTGVAFLQLASQVENFTSESVMLARAFMETITNFCYASICDEKEFRAFLLHPIYKYYFKVGYYSMEEANSYTNYEEHAEAIRQKRKELKHIPIVQEALAMFSETKPNLKWTKKNLNERIEALEKWGKFLDVFICDDTWMCSGLYRVVLCRETKCIKSDREKYIIAFHTTFSGNNLQTGICFDMSYVHTGTAWIWELYQCIIFWFCVIICCCKCFFIIPDLLPLLFYGSVIVWYSHSFFLLYFIQPFGLFVS